MERSWWWKAALYGCPHRAGRASTSCPRWCRRTSSRPSSRSTSRSASSSASTCRAACTSSTRSTSTRRSPSKVDRLASDIEDRLRKDKGVTDLTVTPRGPRRHRLHVQEPGRPGQARRSRSCATTASRWTSSTATPPTGVVRLRLDPDQVEEVRDYALRQGIETIRGRVDKFGVAEPTIIKKGTDIIVELPGLKAADFERIKSIIGRTAQLEFKIVDDGSEYMKKVAAAVPKDSGIEAVAGVVDREGLGQAARGRLPALEEAATRWRSSSPASRATWPSRPTTRSATRRTRARRRRRGDARQVLADVLPAQARGADRRVPVERRPDLGPADRPPRGLASSSTARAPRSPSG